METKDMICIVCPLGCKLKVSKDETAQGGYRVAGNNCFRGADYGVKEMSNPTRVLTTTITISESLLKKLPVRTSEAIPKPLLKEAIQYINKVEVKAPIQMGQVIIKNLLDTGVDVIASRSMYQNSNHEDYSKEYMVQG